MKTLILIRHAKSSWEGNEIDINRPLSSRGFRDAKLLSKELLKYEINPDAIFSSPANRALTTCHTFMDTLDFPSRLLTVTDELYDFEGSQVTKFLHKLQDSYNTVIVFGHNHAFTAIANTFGDKFIDNVPTCGLVKIQFPNDSWKNIDKGHTEMTLFPRDLKS